MPHEEVLELGGSWGLQILLPGHNRIGANMRPPQLGIVIVMVVMRTFPNTARAEDQDAKDAHQYFGQARMRQDGLVLLIVVDDEKTKMQQSGEETAHNPAGEVEIPDGPRQDAG